MTPAGHVRAVIGLGTGEKTWALPRLQRRNRAAPVIRRALRDCGSASAEWTYDGTGRPRPADDRVRLSVTHCDSTLVVLSVRATCPRCHAALRGVGIDLERAGTLPPAAAHLVGVPREIPVGGHGPVWSDPTAVFAAKEAVFKAWCRPDRFLPRRIALTPIRVDRACASGPATRVTVSVRRVGGYWLALSVARTSRARGGR